jgi:anti-sigma regulatory factor (Ser/Thr protein kinase)
MIVRLPRVLDESGALDLLSQLVAARDAIEYVSLDCSQVTFGHPFGSLLSAQFLRHFILYRQSVGLEVECLPTGLQYPQITNGNSYLMNAGFYQEAGIVAGKNPGEARGGPTYLPITEVKSRDFGEQLSSKQMAQSIKGRAAKLAAIVSKHEESQDLIEYCLTEVIRNVFEHSGESACLVMAQRYESKHEVEIAIADEGCGILESLTAAYPGLTSERALVRAIEPGVSGTRRFGPYGNEVNAGFGLYVLSQLAYKCGKLLIWSGDRMLAVTPANVQVLPRPRIQGTGVCLRIST